MVLIIENSICFLILHYYLTYKLITMFLRKTITYAMAGLVMAATGFSSCDKIKDAIKVNVPVEIKDIEFTLPPVTADQDFSQDFTASVDIDALIKQADPNLGTGNIKSAKIESCVLTIDEGSQYEDDNFTALSSVNASIASNTNTNFTKIASINNPAEKFVLDIPVNNDLDLKSYLQGNTFNFRFSGKAKRTTTHTLNCRATIKFKVGAATLEQQ